MTYPLLLFIIFCNTAILASDSLFFKLHFVYGSKPKRAFKQTEKNFFGGIHGGHVYTEVDNNIISFGLDNGKWHILAHRKKIFGKYRIDKDLHWHGDTNKIKMTTILVPITQAQAIKFKHVTDSFLNKAPYDYAFIGMRCAAGAYDILSQIGICELKKRKFIIIHNFYPKRLRLKMLKRATKENWKIVRMTGRETRVWEKD